MVKAIWNGETVAESDETEIVEGNHYFPPESVRKELLEQSDHQTTCPWKGEASYFHLVVDEETNENAAWSYPAPKSEAQTIKDHVAFWNSVEVKE